MPIESCPQCRVPRNARVTPRLRTEETEDGQALEIETRTYHCAHCGVFVRGEEIEISRVARA